MNGEESTLGAPAPVASARPGHEGDLVGRTILQFHVVARLGAGGMGVVYKATDDRLRRSVALKVLGLRYLADDRNKELIFREARSAAAVTHPNIAAIYDVYDTPDGALIAMELVEGESLRARLARGPLAIDETVRIAREIAAGVARAHATRIVHRDLKPDNVMLTADGHVKLLDFGLAKTIVEPEPTAPGGTAHAATAATTFGPSRAGRVMGTPAYMAPEQAAGQPVDVRADVFSFGALLFELLAGEPPFAHRSTGPHDWGGADSQDWRPRLGLRALRPAVPPALAAIVARCLEYDPARRFANAGELVAALDAAGRDRGLSSATLAVGASLALAAGAVGFAVWPRDVAPATSPTVATVASDTAPSLDAVLAIADVPASPTRSPEALAAFRTAMKRVGGDQVEAGLTSLDKALKLDPDFASAQFQRIVITASLRYELDEAGRRRYAKVVDAQAALSARDRELLTAIAPAFRDPVDWPEEVRLLEAFVARRPGDSEAWFVLGSVQTKVGRWADALASLERQAAIEPTSTLSHTVRKEIQVRQRDLAGADATLKDCLARNQREVPCRLELLKLDGMAGHCTAMEADARELTAINPDAPDGYAMRASAGVVLGEPEVAIAQLLASRRSHLAEDERPAAELGDRQSLAAWRGDFTEVLALQDQLDAATPPTLYGITYSGWLRAYFLGEAGDRAGAARVAKATVDRFAAFPRVEQVQGDSRLALDAFMQRGGLLSRAELLKRRDAWVAEWRAKIDATAWQELGFILWTKAYAEPLIYGDLTDADARDALAILPQYGKLPIAGAVEDDLVTAIALQRAGRAAEALPYFEIRARACNPEWDGVLANLWLGRAREAAGDRAGACEAYGGVVRRWGHARPRSISADESRAGMRRLGCAAPP